MNHEDSVKPNGATFDEDEDTLSSEDENTSDDDDDDDNGNSSSEDDILNEVKRRAIMSYGIGPWPDCGYYCLFPVLRSFPSYLF